MGLHPVYKTLLIALYSWSLNEKHKHYFFKKKDLQVWWWSFPKSVSFWPILSNVEESAFVSKAKQENLQVFFCLTFSAQFKVFITSWEFVSWIVFHYLDLLSSSPNSPPAFVGPIQEVPVELLQFSLSSCSVELQRLDLQDLVEEVEHMAARWFKVTFLFPVGGHLTI